MNASCTSLDNVSAPHITRHRTLPKRERVSDKGRGGREGERERSSFIIHWLTYPLCTALYKSYVLVYVAQPCTTTCSLRQNSVVFF